MTHFSYRHLQLQILFALTQNTVLALEECVEVISLIHWINVHGHWRSKHKSKCVRIHGEELVCVEKSSGSELDKDND